MCILAPLSNIPKEFSVQDPRLFCLEAGVLRKTRRLHYSAEEDLFHLCMFGVREEGQLPGE